MEKFLKKEAGTDTIDGMLNPIIFLSLIASLGVVSATLCSPALPLIGEYFGMASTDLHLMMSLFLIGNALGQCISGPLSDQIGQRTVLFGGLALLTLASCCCALATHASGLFAGRFFQGMGCAFGPVLARAIATNNFPENKSAKVQSFGAAGTGMILIAATLCSGQLSEVSWRGSFWLAASFGVLLLFWGWMILKNFKEAPSSPRQISVQLTFSQVKRVLQHPVFLKSTFCHSVTYGLMYAYMTLFPFLLMEFFHETRPAQVSYFSAYMIAIYILGALLASRFIGRWASNPFITFGLVMQLLSGGFLIFSSSSFFSLTALVLLNFSQGILLPLTAAMALAPFSGEASGTASSSLGVLYRLAGSLGSGLICQLPLHKGISLGWLIFLFSCVSLCVFRWGVNASTANQKF